MSAASDMNRFLAGVEKKAFHMAQAAVKDVDEAMDIVQDAMLTLVRKYGGKPAAEWRPLFYRILQNRITDTHRRRTMKGRFFDLFAGGVRSDGEIDVIAEAPDRASADPRVRSELDAASDQLGDAVEALPRRQQQAFLLRTIEGFSVQETAAAMKCSEGSVKTHYSRAVHTLREQLKDHWNG